MLIVWRRQCITCDLQPGWITANIWWVSLQCFYCVFESVYMNSNGYKLSYFAFFKKACHYIKNIPQVYGVQPGHTQTQKWICFTNEYYANWFSYILTLAYGWFWDICLYIKILQLVYKSNKNVLNFKMWD